jgi:hypothetical protein
MKLSSVWTASLLVLAILVAPGCVEHRISQVQPMQPAVQPRSQSPAKEIRAATPVSVAPTTVAPQVQPENPSPAPVSSPHESAMNVPRLKPVVSNPAKPREIVVKDAPPPPQVEVVGAAPGDDYTWISGAWQWRERWIWSSGYWTVKPRPNAVWAKGHWVKRDDGWVWVRGYWR